MPHLTVTRAPPAAVDPPAGPPAGVVVDTPAASGPPDAAAGDTEPAGCCPRLHEAVELVGKRWTGAIVAVLLNRGPLRFSEVAQAIPQLSDRLLSERMKELEARGIVERRVQADAPGRVAYELTDMGRALAPALQELKAWARHWLGAGCSASDR